MRAYSGLEHTEVASNPRDKHARVTPARVGNPGEGAMSLKSKSERRFSN